MKRYALVTFDAYTALFDIAESLIHMCDTVRTPSTDSHSLL